MDIPAAPALVTVAGVDIVATGQWDLSTGDATFTTDDLANAIDASQCPAVGLPIIKLGHVDPRFDGEPAVGRVINLALTASGNKITGDLAGLPAWLGDVMASAYPNRSIEGSYGFVCQIGHTHPFVITALALLGVASPGVGVLNSLPDVGALFGVAAAADPGHPWKLNVPEGGPMTGQVLAAGLTTEDVRRAYYDQPNLSYAMWITELQLNPLQLIVADESTSKVFRVPVTVKAGALVFGDPVEVTVEYVDAPETAKAGAVRFASRDESRAGVEAAWDGGAAEKNLGTDPPATAIKKLYALPADTKTDSKLPHHDVAADGTVGGPNADGCSAAIGACNGAMGGMKGVSAADTKKAYDHLAAHMTALGQEPPEYSGPAADTAASTEDDPAASGDGDSLAAAGANHGPCAEATTHSHAHAAFGSQGGDATHTHEHAHAAGTGDHQHAHASAAATGTTTKGGSTVDFTDEHMTALRNSLGLSETDEITPDMMVAGLKTLRAKADSKVSAGARNLPQGVIAIEQEAWDALNQRVKTGEEYRRRQEIAQRDTVVAAAIREGKLSPARAPHWKRLWDSDPDGTREVLAGLTPNTVPVEDIGSAGGTEDEFMDAEYARLFPPGTFKTENA